MGDAIRSFLDRTDHATEGMCVYSMDKIQLLFEGQQDKPPLQDMSGIPLLIQRLTPQSFLNDPKSRQWRPKKRYWISAVPTARSVIFLVYAIVMFVLVLGGRSNDWTNSPYLGIGAAVGNNMVSMNQSLIATVLIANLPQAVLCYVYILFNSLYTCMVAGQEWSHFANNRKTLRVSSPVGKQRSNYWLQLPYRYSIPLVILSSLLSWLASQSLFLVKINVLERNGNTRSIQPDKSILTCGYSPGAIVLAISVGAVIMLAAVLLGLRTYTPEMPLAATCSATISAACHRLDDDEDAAVLPLQWGVVSTSDGVGHCCFSSKLVGPLVPGRTYK
ncbi:MAG: hypothetical protein Q9169_002992 [Polycauliona sp. 2 TL-2023]